MQAIIIIARVKSIIPLGTEGSSCFLSYTADEAQITTK